MSDRSRDPTRTPLPRGRARRLEEAQWRAGSTLLFLVSLAGALLAAPTGGPPRRAVVYGGVPNGAPYEWLDANGRAEGFYVDLVRALARQVDIDVEFRLLPPPELEARFQAGRIDVQARIYSESRSRHFDYLTQLWTIRTVMAFLPGRATYPSGLDQLQGETLALPSLSVSLEELEQLPAALRPTVRIEEDERKALDLLRQRAVSVVIGNALTLSRSARELGVSGLISKPLRTYSCHLVTQKGRGGEFAWTFNAMAQLASEGTRDQLIEKHLALPPAPRHWREALPALGGLLVLGLVAGSLVFAWNRALRREVEARTQELGASLLEKDALARYLHLTNETLQAFIQNSPLAIVSLDTDGLVRSWNKRAQDLFGWSAAEVIARPLPSSTAEGRAEMRELFARAQAGESIQGLELQRQRKDGAVVSVSVWAAPLCDEAGRVVEVVAFMADTTGERRLAEQLQQAQKMEAVGRLAGGIAHDFNNVLTAITGYSELAMRRVLPGDPLRRHLEGIRTAADKATAFTRQVLSFSRKQALSPRVVDVNDLVASVVSLLRPTIGEQVRLAHVAGRGVHRVRADPGQLQQVILNLAVNARDAMPDGGELTIETANAQLPDEHSPAATGAYAVITVRDTGVGMNEEVRSHLFEPFFTTKEPGRGTGLGLATVHGIVKLSDGHLVVESSPGHGSTFRVYLPRVGEELTVVPAPLADPASGGSETVLLVEDDDAVRLLNLEVLRGAGYLTLEARHGGEALVISERHVGPIHLLITDVVMPHMSGPELAERLASTRPEMRVLLVSGYAADVLLRHGAPAASLPLLAKPFPPDALLRKAREVLAGALGPERRELPGGPELGR